MKTSVFLLVTLFSLFVLPSFAAIVGDYNNDDHVTMDDVIILYAWFQANYLSDPQKILNIAKRYFPYIKGPVVNVPSISSSDFNNDGLMTMDDIIFMFAWLQANTNDSALVTRVAKRYFPYIKGTMVKFPNWSYSSEVSFPIDGIE